MPTKRKSNLSTGRKYQRNKYRRIDPLPKMVCNTPTIINKPKNIEKPNEESVKFNQGPETIEKEIDSCSSLFEAVLNKIKFYGQEFFLLQWFKLLATDNFPFSSICFILFTEFVQRLSQKSTTAMRYSEQSKEFWWTGKMLLGGGGEFLRFMEGFKHKGSIIHGVSQKGFFDLRYSYKLRCST